MKLSDALRGAADRAPLDGLAVDARRAQRRVTTQRGLRTGSGGVLAGGMVVVLGFGVSGALGGSSASSGDDAGRDEAAAVTEDSAGMAGEADGGAMADSSALAWGMCGEPLPDATDAGDDAIATIDAYVSRTEVTDGVLTFGAGLASSIDATVETFGMSGVVLWDGIVVGTVDASTPAGTVAEGDSYGDQLMSDAIGIAEREVELTNCWDGAPLPASKYELVLTQELWDVRPLDEAGDDSDSDSGAEPDAEPGEETDAGIAADASIRLVSEAMPFTVAGDPVDDPFADYLRVDEPEPTPTTPDDEPTISEPTVNEDALDADTARGLYRDGLTGAWDMAPGTQRWIVSGDSSGDLATSWFGCAWEGDGGFPTRSSEMGLLDVAVDTPPMIDVSYGWIVDGNPALESRVTNVSAWDLDGFWDAGSLQLALVRDGRVVAEAYPVNPYQQGVVSIAESAVGTDGAEDSAIAIEPYGYGEGGLPRGESIASELLWRDVSGCWSDAGQSAVEPGTYTLLAMHYLSVGGGDVVYMDGADETLLEEQEARDRDLGGTLADDSPLLIEPDSTDDGLPGGGATGGSTGSAIAPAPDVYEVYDAVDFQVWTSLGTLTVR
ncbi:hypothetical protein [Demequina maris]|uniref:hypothetical protein n=1 Tax=Demequina maris TaxID=1638982 RepID=UPI00078497A2|nr:hypothetical protein [Demequina maris]